MNSWSFVVIVCVVTLAYAVPSPNSDDDVEDDYRSRFACIINGTSWKICRECDPSYPSECESYSIYDTNCKCQDIVVNGEGWSDCQSKDGGTPWCYVDGTSSCQLKVKSEASSAFKKLWLQDQLHTSTEACKNFDNNEFNQKIQDFGNEEFMIDVTLSEDEDLTEAFGGSGIQKDTPEQCQAECLGREKICFGWTFDNFNSRTGTGTCYLKLSSVCCNQNRKKKVKAGAISGFACNNCNSCIACWSTSGACPCKQDVVQLSPQFCSGCNETTVRSAFGAVTQIERACEYNRILFRYSARSGRWVKQRNIKNESCKRKS